MIYTVQGAPLYAYTGAKILIQASRRQCSFTAYSTITAFGFCKPATLPTTAGMCWPLIYPVTAKARALHLPRWKKRQASSSLCWTRTFSTVNSRYLRIVTSGKEAGAAALGLKEVVVSS